MKCSRARRLFYTYLDGELETGQQEALQSHLTNCDACSAQLARLRQQEETLEAAALVPPLPTGLWPQIENAIDEAQQKTWHRRHRAWLLQTAWVAVGVALGVAGGLLLLEQRALEETAAAPVSAAVSLGERTLVAEAFDVTAFGLGTATATAKEGSFLCDPE